MSAWIKKLLAIVNSYDTDLRNIHHAVHGLESVLKERTNIAVDVGFREASHVIVIGRYRGNDYIQSYTINGTDLDGLIRHLREMEKFGNIRRIDSPPVFKAAFKRNLDWSE